MNTSYCVVYLKDNNDPWSEWFESMIDGTYEYCCAKVLELSLDKRFHIKIVEG